VSEEVVNVCKQPMVKACENGTVGEPICSTHYETVCETKYVLLSLYTDKKNQIFHIYKKIQEGSVAKSYVANSASSYMVKYLRISSYIRKPFLIYDFATDPI
jgi:hypothetical protein